MKFCSAVTVAHEPCSGPARVWTSKPSIVCKHQSNALSYTRAAITIAMAFCLTLCSTSKPRLFKGCY